MSKYGPTDPEFYDCTPEDCATTPSRHCCIPWDAEPEAPALTPDRPGGRVPGIGWVARELDLPPGTTCGNGGIRWVVACREFVRAKCTTWTT